MREKKELWKNKKNYGQFVRKMPETTDEKETWYWLRKADLKVETEVMLCAAQDQVIRPSYVTKQPNHRFVECVTRKGKQYLI